MLGGNFTIPFSSNNETAKDLSIHYSYLGLLMRTRNQTDSQELLSYLEKRITDITCYNHPMITTSGEALYASKATTFEAWSNTGEYKNTFDMRCAIDQRVDPDLIDDLNDADF